VRQLWFARSHPAVRLLQVPGPPPPPPSKGSRPPPPPPQGKASLPSSEKDAQLPSVHKTLNKRLAEDDEQSDSKRHCGSLSIMAPVVLRDVNAFERKHQVGQGTYGSVFVGQDKQTREIVALKRINTEQEENGFPLTAIREVKILKALTHVNIVNLKEIVTSKGAYKSLWVCSLFFWRNLVSRVSPNFEMSKRAVLSAEITAGFYHGSLHDIPHASCIKHCKNFVLFVIVCIVLQFSVLTLFVFHR